MIKENELRLNNLVTDEWYDSLKTIIKVDSINEKGINLEIIDDGNWAEIAQRWIKPEYEFNSIFPIPLTEEWLIKFGFRKTWFGYEHVSTGIEIEPLENGTYTICINSNEYHIGEHFKYVNQLQNLYFALTNEELELNK